MKNSVSQNLLLLVLFVLVHALATAQKTLPNIIVVLTDDQGYADVGFNGCKDIPTPGIDRIAKNGVVCTNGYVSYAVCGPSRAGLLTGRYQDRFGFSRNPLLAPNDSTMGLPLSEQTIVDYLTQAGYVTSVLGKWHMGTHPALHPNKRGFTEFFGFLEGGHRYFPNEWILRDFSEATKQNDGYITKLNRNESIIENEQEYLTDALSREAVAFVMRNKSKPFFLYLAYNAPHTPLQAPEKYLSRFAHIEDKKRKTYAAMVSAVDDGVGKLLNTIEQLHLEENTLIFFLSDNGGPTKDNASNNKPLRGYKGDFFEGGIRVPFAVQWKGKIPAGIIYHEPVISLDIFGTAKALVGQATKNELDGVNLIPYFTGVSKGVPHEALFWRGSESDKWAVRTRENKLLLLKDSTYSFNMLNDISEQNNLHHGSTLSAASLMNALNNWKTFLKQPIFLGLLHDDEYSRRHPDRFTNKTDEP